MALLDVLLPCCLIGHVIGKGGCFFSGDGCYGTYADPTKVPWAMSFPNGAVPTSDPVHPTPIYEAVLSSLVVFIVRFCFPLPVALPEDAEGKVLELTEPDDAAFPKMGRRTSLTLVLYGLERVVVEQFRQHPPIEFFGGLSEYQALAVGLALIGVLIEMFYKAGTFAATVTKAVGKGSKSDATEAREKKDQKDQKPMKEQKKQK